jgi:hypothetical protein
MCFKEKFFRLGDNMRDKLLRRNFKYARSKWGPELTAILLNALRGYTENFRISVSNGDLLLLDRNWYVTHAGLVRLATRKHCRGIHVDPSPEFSDPSTTRWAFKATVYKSSTCKGFEGYGDADPSNVSSVVRGAEMRVAETRAVNRALRKAYGIGICSVEELGSSAEPASISRQPKRLPPQSTNSNGNFGAPKVRDRLCQLIRQHQLDASLVKSYAVDFCGTKTLREATREQIESFVDHLADWAEKDRNALLCQLNSYPASQEGAA